MAKVTLETVDQGVIRPVGEDYVVYGSDGVQDFIDVQPSVDPSNSDVFVAVDQNVERVYFAKVASAYSVAQAGNTIKVYDGTDLLAVVAVQADGTQLTFKNGTVLASLATGNVMTFGGTNLDGTSTPAVVTPATIDATLFSGTGPDVPVDPPYVDGTTFTINGAETAAGTDDGGEVMRLTGDMDVRIDMTSAANQITGLNLDGDASIETNGQENAITGVASEFEIIDAYARNPLNTDDFELNFLGNIDYDGTGVAGDGVDTDGNIFLGGLGADIARAGIGNDFLAGGGVAGAGEDALYGGRNADFFFASLSDLSTTDGDSLKLDGGQTTDDAAVQGDTEMDSDWLLLEVADDEDGTEIDLSDDGDSITDAEGQTVISGNDGARISMNEIENVDASGNLYGFLNDIEVALGEGGQMVDGENVGIGASAQLHIIGSDEAGNKFIGGYDNDLLEGFDGSDLLMGGNLHYALNNPNAAGIINNGMDEMYGGAGNDDIVFEADGGIIDGDNNAASSGAAGTDTLWLTEDSLGTQDASDMLDDGALRFDLLASTLSAAAGYGGADVDGTQDQTNYVDSDSRVTVTLMENVIATGLGNVDYLAAGTNDPELVFDNQQNHFGYEGDMTLRGSTGANTLYANTGNDVLEGRGGRDNLSGGEGNDDFVFFLQNSAGDGVDTIHRQKDADNDNIWDTGFVQDFGVNSTSEFGPSSLSVDFSLANLADANVEMGSFSVKIGGVTFAVTDLAALAAATTVSALADLANAAFEAQDSNVSVTASGNVLTITDSTPTGGREFSDTQAEGYAVNITVDAPGTGTLGLPTYVAAGESVSQDRLIYASYEDRADGELVDDNSYTGSIISLGRDAYAQDLVIDFTGGSTRIAEDQSYTVNFTNLTTEDTVSVTVNGVTYTLTVGVDLDGNELAEEELTAQGGTAANQAELQHAFLARLSDYINTFMDDDTAAGQVVSRVITSGVTTRAIDLNNDGDVVDLNIGGDAAVDEPLGSGLIVGLTLTQAAYTDSEETVFMRQPTVTLTNGSGGETASRVIANTSQHEVLLLNFDGQDAKLHDENVIFIGDSGESRAILATADDDVAGALSGTEAVVIDGGTNTLQATVSTTGAEIADNTATNSFLRADFTVHGDDFLIGGNALDTITAGTGDDRVHGSLGADVIDGGKSFYAVRVLGETGSRVFVLNQWEAEHTGSVTALNGLTITGVTRIDDVETGLAGPTNVGTTEVYEDTLQFQQGDFTTGATEFTVTLSDFVMSAGQVQLTHGGAGTVGVDTDGNGTFESTTSFTNFEHIRTVSGTGNAVAGDGQGNDTLNVSAISSTTTGASGVSYDLTNGANAGQVRYSTNAHVSLTNPATADFDALMISVDGVENVTSGTGDDLLLIDETEAAKDNTFTASTGDDRIEYQNDFGTADVGAAEPTVTITVNTATDTDTVEMTAGRVGSVLATDTLTSVEIITLLGETAQGVREDDVLDVTAMTSGAVVNYNDILVTNETAGTAPGTIRTTAGVLQLTVENMYEIENVVADGDDTVILADAAVMSLNAHTDENDTDEVDIIIDSFLNFDLINEDDLTDRLSLVDLASGIEDVVDDVNTDLPQTLNFAQFTFSMSAVGVDTDNDTIDYSQTGDSIAAVVNFDEDQDTQYVLVDGNSATFVAIDDDDSDRVDAIISAENIVAAQGESILDLTGADQNLRISFSNNYDNVADWNAAFNADYGREIHEIKVASATTGASVISMNYLDYKFIDTDTTDATPAATDATWTSIEGSDFNETVDLSGWEADAVNTLNLRGGDNQVNYEGDSVEITIDVVDFDETDPTNTGLIEVLAVHTAPGDDHNAATVDADVFATDVITSYSAQNEIADGSLTIKGARGDLDTIAFAAGLGDKFFILGGVTDATSSITVTIDEATAANSLELVGFETLQDAATDDTYRMDDLQQVQEDLAFLDNVTNDTDTIMVTDDAIDFDGGPAELDTAAADTISLEVLNDVFGFDFDVLDITNVTDNNLLLVADDDDQDDDATLNANAAEDAYVGPRDVDGDGDTSAPDLGARFLTDDVVVGNLDLIDDVDGFDNIWFTAASITSAGSEYVLDLDAGELQDDSAALFTTNAAGLNFSRITTAVTVTVVDDGANGAIIVGGSAADIITGGAGDDTFTGGAGADTLDGGFVPEVLETLTFGFNNGGTLGTTFATNADYIEITDGTGAVRFYGDGSIAGDVDGFAGGAASVALAAAATTALTVSSDNDIVGNTIANLADASWATYLPDFTIGDVSYEAVGNVLTFTYATGENPTDNTQLTMTVVDAGAAGTLTANTIVVDGNVANSAQGDAYSAEANSADTFVFEATAALNGADTILNFDATDVLDFTAFATDNAPVAEVADDGVGDASTVDNDIYLISDADGSINTVAEVLALFAASGTPFDSTLVANAEFVIAIRDTQADGDTTLWYIDNGNNTALAASEITLVGTLVDYNTALVDGNILD